MFTGKDLPLHLQSSAPATNGHANGNSAPKHTVVLPLDKAEQQFVFDHVDVEPVPSVLRNFSAPVRLEVEGQTDDNLLFLFAHDSDPFNRCVRQVARLYYMHERYVGYVCLYG